MLTYMRGIAFAVYLGWHRSSKCTMRQLRRRLEKTIGLLQQEYRKTAHKKPKLELTVHMQYCPSWNKKKMDQIPWVAGRPDRAKYAFQFALETLVPLSPLSRPKNSALPHIELEITGVEPRFAEALKRYVAGKGEPLKKIDYEAKEVVNKGKKGGRTPKKRQLEQGENVGQKWWEPMWHWASYAETQGIGIPDYLRSR
jgi:hypothetical protein